MNKTLGAAIIGILLIGARNPHAAVMAEDSKAIEQTSARASLVVSATVLILCVLGMRAKRPLHRRPFP